MMLGKISGRIIWIRASERFRLLSNKRFCTNNKSAIEPSKNGGSLTHHDSYRDLDKLDFMTAAKILFTTPPKQKKFGLDFHLVQLFFVCLPSLVPIQMLVFCVSAVYLVAQYARHEMKKMDAELEVRRAEEAKKVKTAEADLLKSNPQLMEVKERLENLEKTVKEMVVESKNQRSIKISSDRIQPESNPAVEDRRNKEVSGKHEAQPADSQKGLQGSSSRDKNK